MKLSRLLAGLAIASLSGGLLFALIQPLNASNLFFFQRWAFWSLHGLVGFGFALLAEYVLLQTSLNRIIRLLIILSLVSFVLAPFSLYFDDVFHAVDLDPPPEAGWLELYLEETIDIAPLSILVVGAVTLLAHFLLDRPRAPATATQQEAGAPRLSEILEGVPPTLGDDLIRIAAQDHYTEVITALGAFLLNKSLSDCVSVLNDFDGVQTHRSHWVNLAHIVDVKRVGSAYECKLSNDECVPVSRRRYSMLKHLFRKT